MSTSTVLRVYSHGTQHSASSSLCRLRGRQPDPSSWGFRALVPALDFMLHAHMSTSEVLESISLKHRSAQDIQGESLPVRPALSSVAHWGVWPVVPCTVTDYLAARVPSAEFNCFPGTGLLGENRSLCGTLSKCIDKPGQCFLVCKLASHQL